MSMMISTRHDLSTCTDGLLYASVPDWTTSVVMIFVNVYSDDGGCEGDDGCTYLTNILRLGPETPHHPKPSNPLGSKPQSSIHACS